MSMSPMPCRSTAVLSALLALAGAAPALADVVTVGHSADCDYRAGPGLTPLDDAVRDNASEIRVQIGDLDDRPVLVGGRSVAIRGGYESCAAARLGLEPIGHTRIRVNSEDDGRPFTLISLAVHHTVTLENLILEDDRPNADHLTDWGGGISAIGHIDLRIRNSVLRRLQAGTGGGAIATLYGVRVTLIDSEIVLGTSYGNGGGIHCRDGGSIVVDAGSLLFSNYALGVLEGPGNGGAIVAEQCEVTILGRSDPSAMYPQVRGLIGNAAYNDGGAIHATESTLTLLGGHHCPDGTACPNLPVLLRDNRANAGNLGLGDGGAIYAQDSPIRMDQFVLMENSAINGGAIAAVGDGGGQRMDMMLGFAPEHLSAGPDGRQCWHDSRCNWIVGNTAVNGGVFEVEHVAMVLDRARVEGNVAHYASVLNSDGDNLIVVRSSVLVGNGESATPRGDFGNTLFWLYDSVMSLLGNTVAHNLVTDDLVKLEGETQFHLSGNLIFEPALDDLIDLLPGGSHTVSGACNAASIDLGMAHSPVISDPGFRDAGNGDYRLQADSVARDLCPEPIPSTAFDFTRYRRGMPATAEPTRYDAGAYEFRSDRSGRFAAHHAVPVAIDDNGYDGTLASMHCQVMEVSALPAGATVEDISVGMAIDHRAVGDLTAKLVHPDGMVLALFERPRGDDENPPGDVGAAPPYGDESDLSAAHPIVFHDVYTNDAEHMGQGIESGANVCEHDGRCEFRPTPDQALLAGNSVASFADMIGERAGGAWQLCLADSAAAFTGTLQSWFLSIDYIADDADVIFANGFQCGPAAPGCAP